MVLRVFAGACVLYAYPLGVYYMIQICRRRGTEAQVALRTNLGTYMRARSALYPVCDTCFKGRREVGKPKKYELKEEKDKIAYF